MEKLRSVSEHNDQLSAISPIQQTQSSRGAHALPSRAKFLFKLLHWPAVINDFKTRNTPHGGVTDTGVVKKYVIRQVWIVNVDNRTNKELKDKLVFIQSDSISCSAEALAIEGILILN